MQNNTDKRRLMAIAVITAVLTGAIYRLTSIAYSYVYADITFADSFVAFMYYVSAVAEGIMWGALTCCVSVFSLKFERKAALCLVPAAAGLLVNYGAGFIYDLITVSVSGMELLALASTIIRTAAGTLLCFIAFLFSRSKVKKGASSPSRVIMPASLTVLAVSLISRTAELVEDLIENAFSITALEILSLVGEYVEIVLLMGVLVFASARLFWALSERFQHR
jgi:hypothetical protein